MISVSSSGAPVRNLTSWLKHIEQLHPKTIAMGLDRVQQVLQRLALKPDFKIITVAGTNGKGSTCAMLSQIYLHAGYRVACYTSPHLLRYNERVRLNGEEVSDEDLCLAFAAVEQARLGNLPDDEISLTYFEVGTLAAVWHFCQQNVDIAILEIGLGGRLDAVNVFNPDCAIVTSVDIDHQEFLGTTRESIGMEKAGVYRAGVPAICGDINPPETLVNHALKIHANFMRIQHDFAYHKTASGWQFLLANQVLYDLPLPALEGDYQLTNASSAIAAVNSLQTQLPVGMQAIADAMSHVTLAGRFQTVLLAPKLILDVAHNPHAAIALAKNLKAHKVQINAKTFAIFSMLADKDISGVVDALKDEIDVWYVASIDHVRSASVTDLVSAILLAVPKAKIKTFASIADACKNAKCDMQTCLDSNEDDKIVAFGSFFTVSNVMQCLNEFAAANF